ncbi:MAG: hypothetical protein Fur0032_12940 [Terrimicrobiaceae bacterium]
MAGKVAIIGCRAGSGEKFRGVPPVAAEERHIQVGLAGSLEDTGGLFVIAWQKDDFRLGIAQRVQSGL